jgi:hypothetical protein
MPGNAGLYLLDGGAFLFDTGRLRFIGISSDEITNVVNSRAPAFCG